MSGSHRSRRDNNANRNDGCDHYIRYLTGFYIRLQGRWKFRSYAHTCGNAYTYGNTHPWGNANALRG